MQQWSESLPLTHSRDIAAGFSATVPPKADEPSVSLQPSCLLHSSHLGCTYVSFTFRFIAPCNNKINGTDVSQVGTREAPGGLKDDCHCQRATNYRLKSGRVGRLLLHSRTELNVGVYSFMYGWLAYVTIHLAPVCCFVSIFVDHRGNHEYL